MGQEAKTQTELEAHWLWPRPAEEGLGSAGFLEPRLVKQGSQLPTQVVRTAPIVIVSDTQTIFTHLTSSSSDKHLVQAGQ